MNLLKALEGISNAEKPQGDDKNTEKNRDGQPPAAQTGSAAKPERTGYDPPSPNGSGGFNVMQSVLERHESLSNKVKNRK